MLTRANMSASLETVARQPTPCGIAPDAVSLVLPRRVRRNSLADWVRWAASRHVVPWREPRREEDPARPALVLISSTGATEDAASRRSSAARQPQLYFAKPSLNDRLDFHHVITRERKPEGLVRL